MFDPRTLSMAATLRIATLSERLFLDQALDHLANNPLACFLDSAGAIGSRARQSLYSGEARGLFLQEGDVVVFHDFVQENKQTLSKADFEEWVTRFHMGPAIAAGPALFPLLTYEAYNPHTRPARPHPIWGEAEAVWLLTTNTFVYDREKQELRYREPRPGAPIAWPNRRTSEVSFGWRESEEVYHRKIDLVKQDIYHGLYYQANLSQRFLGRTKRTPIETYRALRKLNPSPFMGIFRMGECWVLSGSPERLVDMDGDRISARPIAGTKPRHKDLNADAASMQELVTSAKERAEHLMLVDLVRNDLGRVARSGSVNVEEFCTIETYSHVHHLVSQICARIRADASVFDLIRAAFPGGTITGAPKISCIQRLAVLEEEARGPYTGSMGYLTPGVKMDLNILIRTMIQRGDSVCFHGGGGIVADSVHHSEYLETRQKCQALMEALQVNC